MLKFFSLALLLFCAFLIRKALLPLGIGLVLAYILDPFVCRLENKWKGKRLLCILITYLFLWASVIFLAAGFAYMILGNLRNATLHETLRILQAYYLAHQELIERTISLPVDAASIGTLLQSMGSSLLQIVVGMIISIYLLKDKAFFLRNATRLLHLFLSQKTHGIIRELCFDINLILSAFLRGVLIDSVIVAFLSSSALWVLEVEFAVFIGCFAGMANVIPYFGPVIGIVPAVVAALADGGITKAILAACSLFLIQQVECNLIYPRIVGNSTGLHPLLVLTAVTIAAYYGGLISMILAVPLAGIFKVLVQKWACAQ